MTAAEIGLRDVGKRYGSRWAVRGVSFTVAAGEFFTLLGPSGCGKTTVLRMIGGFLDPDEGEIRLDGDPVLGVPPSRRGLGLVFRNYALWPHLSVFEHVAFGLREHGVPRAEIGPRVRDALQMVGLEGLERRRPSELSGAQPQRVALARTLVMRPRALLLDDPLSALGAAVRTQMRLEFRRLHRELGITTLYVTEDEAEAMALSTRIAVFDRGAVVQVGAPAEVYRRPRTRFVAEFLGAANLLPGTIEAAQGETRVRLTPSIALAIAAGGLPVEAHVLCLIRPEAIHLNAPAGSRNRLDGTIASVIYLGGRHDCEIALAGGLVLRAEMVARGAIEPPKAGDAVFVTIPPEDVIVLRDPRAPGGSGPDH